MEFLVTLFKAPNRLNPAQRAELDANCRHVDGRWWIMEGDVECLNMRARPVADGVTTGLHPDDVPPGGPIIDHAVDIFDLPEWPPPDWWYNL